MLLSAECAEDLVQECLIAGWKSLRKYQGRCQFFTWLCAIMLNQHRNLKRKRWPVILSQLFHGESNEPKMENFEDTGLRPDAHAELAERAELVVRCMQKLSRKHREVIHLRFYVDDSLEGIANALGCSTGTVKSRLFHALEKLRSLTETARKEMD
jgi:RNA polymerase sigma-70 factor (ECF subfamily)